MKIFLLVCLFAITFASIEIENAKLRKTNKVLRETLNELAVGSQTDGTCTTHDGKAKANGDEWCGHRGNSVACMDGKIVVLRIGCDVKNCHHDSDCPADSECKVVGLASICKPKGRLAHEGKHAHAHKHKKSKHSSSDSSDSSDPSDGHNRASKTPAHKNMNLDAVLFSNTFQNSVVQALAIVGVLYVLYLGYRSATSALRSKYETIPSAAAEGV